MEVAVTTHLQLTRFIDDFRLRRGRYDFLGEPYQMSLRIQNGSFQFLMGKGCELFFFNHFAELLKMAEGSDK
jgi:hypothetical protein